MKKVSMLWSLLVGLVSVLWQTFSYYFRFGKFNPYSLWTDYLWFFIAGVLGGVILVLFLNRQITSRGRWSVLGAFILATPVAMIFMVGGGLLGFIGILIFPQIPWTITSWLGSWLGKFLSQNG